MKIKGHLQRLVAMVLICSIFGSCASVNSGKEISTAKSVDLKKYVGTWYEIARLPMWAQRNCLRSMAEYWELESGDIGVRNSCVTKDAEEITIEGTAKVLDPENHAKLNVRFDRWWAKLAEAFTGSDEGNYWILRVDSDYQWAVVGTPDREFLWILARNPNLDESTYLELVSFSRDLGFQTENLIRRQSEKG